MNRGRFKPGEMRYCRVVFSKKGWPDIEIDFGYCDTEQKMAGVKKLREQYKDHHFIRCFSIPTPASYESMNPGKGAKS